MILSKYDLRLLEDVWVDASADRDRKIAPQGVIDVNRLTDAMVRERDVLRRLQLALTEAKCSCNPQRECTFNVDDEARDYLSDKIKGRIRVEERRLRSLKDTMLVKHAQYALNTLPQILSKIGGEHG